MEIRTYDKTYVAMLDVLGFKDLVNNNSHVDLLKIYENLSNTINDGLSLYKFNRIVTDAGFTIERDMSKTIINSMTISDSLVLWTDNTSAQSFYDLIITVRFVLFHSIHTGIPLRGGISLGPLSIINKKQISNADNQQITFIGKSIVDSYEMEQMQDWSGCVIKNECIDLYQEELKIFADKSSDPNRMLRALSVDSLVSRGFICKYDVPLKDDKHSNEFVMNWPSVTSNMRLSENTVRQSFARHNKSVEKEKIQKIIQNTINFLSAAPEAKPIRKI